MEPRDRAAFRLRLEGGVGLLEKEGSVGVETGAATHTQPRLKCLGKLPPV